MNDMVEYYSGIAVNPESKKEIAALKSNVKNFIEELNQLPTQEMGNVRDNNPYIVISHIEMCLDELFLGHWNTINFEYQQVANEIIGSIQLEILHPVTGVWLKRVGAGAVQIQQDKRASISSILDTKKKNALEKGFPKLKAMCLKNAANSIGKIFGRDLGRKQVSEYDRTKKDGGAPYDIVLRLEEICTECPEVKMEIAKKYGTTEGIPERKARLTLEWAEKKCASSK